MKKLFFTCTVALASLAAGQSHAQAPGISWKNIYEQFPSTEYGYCAEPTFDGGYIVGGISASHFWVFKLDGSGSQQWSRFISSGTGLTTVYAIRQTTDTGYIVAGSDYTTGSTDSTNNHGIRDFFVVKLKSNGDVDWKKCFGGSSNEEASAVEQTSDGGYIVAGYAGSNDGQVTGWHGGSDYWVVKLDASGNITWQKTLGGTFSDYATSVAQTNDGGYIVAGYSGSKDGDVTGTHWGGSDDDVWVVKLDASGNVLWQKAYGGSKEDRAYSIRQTTDGGYIVAGSTVSSDGDVTGKHGTSQDNQDYWVIKLDASGGLTWQKCLGGSGPGIGAGSGNDIAYSICQTTEGGYVVAGTVSSGDSVNDDITGYHGHTGSDYWVVKLDASGSITWEKCLGGNGTEDARTIAQTPDGGYIIAGSSQFSPDGDVVSPDYGDNHPWIVKLGGTTAVAGLAANSMNIAVYPNPANDRVTIANMPLGAVLHITDVTGRTVYTTAVTNAREIVSTQNFVNGMYIAQVEDKGSLSQVKFIVAR